jgi:hypothetical protein
VPKFVREYANLVKDTTGLYGTYPPDTKLKVGQYFKMDGDGALTHIGDASNVTNWPTNVSVTTENHTGTYSYNRGLMSKKRGEAAAGLSTPAGGLHATIDLSFDTAGGFVLDYVAEAVDRYAELQPIMTALVALSKNGKWKSSWILITEVRQAASASIVVAGEKSQKFRLRGAATMPVDITGVNLTDPKLGLSGSSYEGAGFACVATKATPLYRCLRIRRDWLLRKHAELAGAAGEVFKEAIAEDPFTDEDDV